MEKIWGVQILPIQNDVVDGSGAFGGGTSQVKKLRITRNEKISRTSMVSKTPGAAAPYPCLLQMKFLNP